MNLGQINLQILAAVNEDVLWVLTPFNFVDVYRRFRGTCCFLGQSKRVCDFRYYGGLITNSMEQSPS